MSNLNEEITRKVAQSDTRKLATTDTPKAINMTRRALVDAAANHPDFQVREGAKQLLAGVRKGGLSPLVERTRNPVVGRMDAPAAPPVPQRGNRNVGSSPDLAPASSVDSTTLSHLHRHEGTTENVRAYFHDHVHDHPVRHDPDDPATSHDDRKHLNDVRHTAAKVGYEAKSSGASAEDQIAALRADSKKTEGFLDHRDFGVRRGAEQRIQENATTIEKLAGGSGRRGTINKAHAARIAPADVQKMVVAALGPAIAKSIGDLVDRLNSLQERNAPTLRKRL